MISHTEDEWQVKSKSGKPLGKYDSKKKALKRLAQIEYWKHIK